MEFCPEIAILQSSFQLVEQKAGKDLGSLKKASCKDFIHIITTAVEEICRGLEQDHEPEDRLLWQQKLHLLVLYALVSKKYRCKQEERAGCVPVLTQLDTLIHPLPTFSAPFYFELVKLCGWEHCFIDSLQYLDTQLAVQLLHDATDHCQASPVTGQDISLVTVAMETLLSSLLTTCSRSDSMLDGMTADLYRKRKFIQTVYPDETGQDPNSSATVNSQHGDNLTAMDSDLLQIGDFWSSFIQSYPTFIPTALDYLSRKHFECQTDAGLDGCSGKAKGFFAQLVFLWYSLHVEQASEYDSWFVNNVGQGWVEGTEVSDKTAAKCVLNYQLISSISSQLSKETLLSALHSCLLAVQKSVQGNNKLEESEWLMCSENIEIVSGIQISSHVLLHMLQGTLCKDKCHKMATEEDFMLNKAQEFLTGGGELRGEWVVLGESWQNDVTLPVLLWRIQSHQPQAEACMELLLSEGCQPFWYLDSVYDVLEKSIHTLIPTSSRVLKLMRIASCIHGDAPREINQRILTLILGVFSGLLFPDQDYIVKEMYRGRPSDVERFVADQAFKVNLTNVFNKLTAEKDEQVQKEILQLCLTDPVSVVRQAVEICIRNQEQAITSAKVLQHMWKTCSCHHLLYHPHVSLLCHVMHEFVTSVQLTDKEQKHFLTFLAHVLQMDCGPQPLLSPLEFLHTTVLPHTGVMNFTLSNSPISAKFALDLLITSLTASCNKRYDWSKADLEPVVVVAILAQVLHETVVLWDGELGLEVATALDINWTSSSRCSQFSLAERASIREKGCQCFNLIADMLEKGYISTDDQRMEWLLQETAGLHWTVQYRLLSLLTACGWQQYAAEWASSLQDCMIENLDQLTPVLMLACLEPTLLERDIYLCNQYAAEWASSLQDCMIDNLDQLTPLLMLASLDSTLAHKIPPEVILDSSEVIASLAQVWPHLLQEECERVMVFLEQQLSHGSIPLAYRHCGPSLMPLIHWTTEHTAILGISQILRDVILTLALTLPEDKPSTTQMLTHAVQNYIAAVKVRCEYTIKPVAAQLFVLYQMFLHVCDITLHLPPQVSDLNWVLLLNITTQFTAICTDCRKVGEKVSQPMVERLARNWEYSMSETVQGLGQCEERDMIVKRLQQ